MSKERPRALVADDEMVMRMYIVSLLAKMNYEVVGEACEGDEAVRMFREKKPDVLLMDINMPLKTGEEALREIRAEFPNALVIMLTLVVGSGMVEHCIDLGAAGYIRKDTPGPEIQNIIREILKAHEDS
jgi:DNA-binding NarL/FixJ family response regulator